MEVTLTDKNFDDEVLKADVPVLVDFWAPWCGPCQMMIPILEDLAKEIADKAKIAKLNVDENPDKAQEYSIMSIPAIKIFKGGKIIHELVGVQTKDTLKTYLEKAA
jgi:thioredoxin 1